MQKYKNTLEERYCNRKIIHIDMDAFFASVEQLDNPSLRGKAVAVSNGTERGVVSAASYKARKHGVKSAMPNTTALKKCPSLIFVKPRFDRYKELSTEIMNLFYEYTPLVEPLSIDEAFLDTTTNLFNIPYAMEIAEDIRHKIKTRFGLTASAGVSYNKFLAKVASDINKPDGIYIIPPSKAQDFINKLPIERFYGVGKVTATKMHQLGIYNGFDLRGKSLSYLTQFFGKQGQFYHYISQGIDLRPVSPHRERKSISVENTLSHDINNEVEIYPILEKIATELHNRATTRNYVGHTITLKVKYSDFTHITRSITTSSLLNRLDDILENTFRLWKKTPFEKKIRLLGLRLSSFSTKKNNDNLQLKIPFN